MFDKCDPKKQKHRYELMPNTKFQRSRVFVRNDLAERKIKSCKLASKQFLEFKEKLGLGPCKITCDEQDIIIALQVAFEGEILHTQYCIENKRLDGYLPKYKYRIGIDEHDHVHRDPGYEQSRQLMIEGRGITVIKTYPDAPDFNINRLINQIYMNIIKPTKKKLKNELKNHWLMIF